MVSPVASQALHRSFFMAAVIPIANFLIN